MLTASNSAVTMFLSETLMIKPVNWRGYRFLTTTTLIIRHVSRRFKKNIMKQYFFVRLYKFGGLALDIMLERILSLIPKKRKWGLPAWGKERICTKHRFQKRKHCFTLDFWCK